MKEAFVHCRLLPGGAQAVLENIISQSTSKNSRIFTFVSNKRSVIIDGRKIEVKTVLPKVCNNFILRCSNKNIPLLSNIFDYRNFIILAPLRAYIMSRQIKSYNPDHIYISSFAWSKNIKTHHINTTLYLHSPMQYIRSHYEEYRKKITGRKGKLFNICVGFLRARDKKPRTYNQVIANSKYTAQLAKQIYNLDAKVQYPTINPHILHANLNTSSQEYFIYAGRVVTFVKELDIIIAAYNRTGTPLIIMGDGPDKEILQKVAGEGIIFIPWVQDITQRINIIQNAKGMINITKESFGISTMESLLLGVPVLGYNQGASTELIDKDSGILIETKDIDTIVKAIQKFDTISFDRKTIQAHARMVYNTYHK